MLITIVRAAVVAVIMAVTAISLASSLLTEEDFN